MRRLYLAATLVFWISVLALWSLPAWRAGEKVAPAPTAPAPARAPTLAEVARHHTASDCWMVIDGQVYDVTPYVMAHPADPAVILAWCGEEATEAYRTKLKRRPHSAHADSLLPRYRVGPLGDGR